MGAPRNISHRTIAKLKKSVKKDLETSRKELVEEMASIGDIVTLQTMANIPRREVFCSRRVSETHSLKKKHLCARKTFVTGILNN